MNRWVITYSVIVILAVVAAASWYGNVQRSDSVDGLKKRMILAYNNNNYETAINLAIKIIQLEDSSLPHQVLSDCYYKKGQMDNSLKHAEKAISYDPKNQYLYYLRGRILLQKGDLNGCSDITKTIQAKGWFLSSSGHTIDYMDTSSFMDVNYRDLLNLRVTYCDQIIPDQVKIDREILRRGR